MVKLESGPAMRYNVYLTGILLLVNQCNICKSEMKPFSAVGVAIT